MSQCVFRLTLDAVRTLSYVGQRDAMSCFIWRAVHRQRKRFCQMRPTPFGRWEQARAACVQFLLMAVGGLLLKSFHLLLLWVQNLRTERLSLPASLSPSGRLDYFAQYGARLFAILEKSLQAPIRQRVRKPCPVENTMQ